MFSCYGKKSRGKPVSIKCISECLKVVISESYTLTNLSEPFGIKGHHVRKLATSYADMAGVDPEKICNAAT